MILMAGLEKDLQKLLDTIVKESKAIVLSLHECEKNRSRFYAIN